MPYRCDDWPPYPLMLDSSPNEDARALLLEQVQRIQ